MKTGNSVIVNCFVVKVISAISLFCGCSPGSGTTTDIHETSNPTSMSMSYDQFTGNRQAELVVKEDRPVVVTAVITTRSGRLDARIVPANKDTDNPYEGHNLPTSIFTVRLTEPGNYTIRADAKDHAGSFSFSWGD